MKIYVFDSFISLKNLISHKKPNPIFVVFKFDNFKWEILWKIVNILECSFHNILLVLETSLTAVFYIIHIYSWIGNEWVISRIYFMLTIFLYFQRNRWTEFSKPTSLTHCSVIYIDVWYFGFYCFFSDC